MRRQRLRKFDERQENEVGGGAWDAYEGQRVTWGEGRGKGQLATAVGGEG